MNTTASMRIAPAQSEDLPQLALLEQRVFETVVYPEFFFRQAHDLWPDFLLLAWNHGQLAGYILAAPAQQGPHSIGILSLAVAPEFRGAGVGAALLNALLLQLPQDCQRLWLTVAPENLQAVKLYTKFGFHQEKHLENYYGQGEHRLILAKQLG